MTTLVSVAPEILEWVTSNIIGTAENQKAFRLVEQWKAGEKVPTFNQIEEVSRALHVPFGYFFLQEPPREDYSFLQYRTVKSERFAIPSRELVDTIQDMVTVQDWMRDYVKNASEQTLPIVGSGAHDNSVEALAARIRNDIEIPTNWYEMTKDSDDSFKFLRGKCEGAGIIVMMSGIVGNYTKRALNLDEFRAFTLVDEFAPLIFVNATDSLNGRLFSLLHEMAHVWIGESSVFNGSNFDAKENGYHEMKCNAVAAEILIPRDAFVKRWLIEDVDDYARKVCRVAHYFRCSTTAIARRALENNFIARSLYQEIADQAQIDCVEKAKRTGGNFYSTMATRIDTRFLFALASSVFNGTTLHTEAYKLTNTNRITFGKLLETVRG